MSILRRCAQLALKRGQHSEAFACTSACAPISLSVSGGFAPFPDAPSGCTDSSRSACTAASFRSPGFSSHGACHQGGLRCYGMQAVDPWQDKISSNFRGGNEKVINVPIDEFSEHVSITNEIEKTLQEADSIEDIFEIVAQHKDEFEGPNVATAFMALHHHTPDMSPEEHRQAVHGRPEFEILLRMVEERSFDVFTLMQTLQSLVGLHLKDEELLSNISARLTTLVQASDAKQLLKLIKRMCKSEYVPTRNLLEAIHRRVNTVKGTVHPETCSDIERAVTKLAVLMSEGRSKQKAMSVGQ